MTTYREKFEKILKEKMIENNQECNALLLKNLVEMGLYNIMKKPYFKGIYDAVRFHLMFEKDNKRDLDWQATIDNHKVNEESAKWVISITPPNAYNHISFNHVHNNSFSEYDYAHFPYVDDKELLFLENFYKQLNQVIEEKDNDVKLNHLNDLMSCNQKQYFLLNALFRNIESAMENISNVLCVEHMAVLKDKLSITEWSDLFKEENRAILEANHVYFHDSSNSVYQYFGKTKPVLMCSSSQRAKFLKNDLNKDFYLDLAYDAIYTFSDGSRHYPNIERNKKDLLLWKTTLENCIEKNHEFRKLFSNELLVFNEAMNEMMTKSPELKRSPNSNNVECEFVLFDFHNRNGNNAFSTNENNETFWYDGHVSRITLKELNFNQLYDVFYGVDALDLLDMKGIKDGVYNVHPSFFPSNFKLLNMANVKELNPDDESTEMIHNMQYWLDAYKQNRVTSLLMMRNKINGDLMGVVKLNGCEKNKLVLKISHFQINKNYSNQGFGKVLMEELNDLAKREGKFLIYNEENSYYYNRLRFKQFVSRYDSILDLKSDNPFKKFLHTYLNLNENEDFALKSKDEYFEILEYAQKNPKEIKKILIHENYKEKEYNKIVHAILNKLKTEKTNKHKNNPFKI